MKNWKTPRTLILAWGNLGRLDDGLGPNLAKAVSDLTIPGLEVISEYQLQVEHAWEIKGFDRVIFVDADRTCSAPFTFAPLAPEGNGLRYTSHELSPAAVLALAGDLYGVHPEAWLMGIRGYDFDEFGEWLSSQARDNLGCASAHLKELLRKDISSETAAAGEPTRGTETI